MAHLPGLRSFVNVGSPSEVINALAPLVSMLQARSSFRSNTRCHVLYGLHTMAVSSFSRRRLPDLLTEELVFVLSQKKSYEFKQLFEVLHDNLRRRNAAYGGEEILRLRAYDKLQKLVFSGAVKKNGKTYTGNSTALAAMAANAPHADQTESNA